ncbi:hypothetical protein [Streptomyces sp. NPDC053079]|uniref:hypothetical protein n=1 Tax=Streptomyces sp. NPDC053079 TaxID=3365697 RepID=UPI0037D8AF91
MRGPGNDEFDVSDSQFDPDAVLWVRGVDYVGGWRDALGAADELSAALADAGVRTEGATSVAQTGPDGSGVVRLVWPAEVVRAVAALVRYAGELRQAD